MKFKFLSIFMSVTLALAFTSCGDKESIYTGDPIKDARAYVEKAFSLLENATTIEDVEKAEKQDNEMFHELKEAYKDKPQKQEQFDKEVLKLMSGEFKERFEKIQEKIMNLEQKASKKKEETMATEEKQKPEVIEAVDEMEEEVVSPEDKLEDF